MDSTTDASPSASHIADSIEDRIRRGIYKTGQWLPTERSLAGEFQVSRIVVRAAIKEAERRQLVTCSAHCRPLVRAHDGASSRPRTRTRRRSLALWIWPNPTWPGSMMIINGIRRNLDNDDFRLVLESPIGETNDALLRSEERFLRRISSDHDVEGVMLWYLGGEANLPALQALREARIPMVFLDREPPPTFDADYVGVNNVRAAEGVVNHLIDLGHLRIAHITNLDAVSTTEERLLGYRRALERRGPGFDPGLVVTDTGENADDADYCGRLVRELMSLAEPPTAFFAVNDIVAIHLAESLRKGGWHIPDDVSVAGFDGTEHWSHGQAFLTSIRQPFEQIGSDAVDLLLERIDTKIRGAFRHIMLEAPLYEGASTGTRRPTGQSRTSARGDIGEEKRK